MNKNELLLKQPNFNKFNVAITNYLSTNDLKLLTINFSLFIDRWRKMQIYF